MEKNTKAFFFFNAKEQELISDLEAPTGSTHTQLHILHYF